MAQVETMIATTQIPLIDGPLAGQCHELHFGFGVPDQMGLPDETMPNVLHWYKIQDGNGYFLESKNKK